MIRVTGSFRRILTCVKRRTLRLCGELIRQADVFSQGYRPGTLAGRGLAPKDLAGLRPGIVYVSLSAFGRVGPWASRRGFDTVVQTVSGITARQGELFPGAEPGPQFYPVSAIDYLTGYLMAFGTLLALARRAREGGSWLVRISLAQTGSWLVGRGQVPEAELQEVPEDFTPDEIARWSTFSDLSIGGLAISRPCCNCRKHSRTGLVRRFHLATTNPFGQIARKSNGVLIARVIYLSSRMMTMRTTLSKMTLLRPPQRPRAT